MAQGQLALNGVSRGTGPADGTFDLDSILVAEAHHFADDRVGGAAGRQCGTEALPQDRSGLCPVSMWSAVIASRGLRRQWPSRPMPRNGRAGYRYQYVETAASPVFSIDTARNRDRKRSTKLCRAACDLVMKFGAFRSRFATNQQQTVAFLGFGLDDVFSRLLDASRNLGPCPSYPRSPPHRRLRTPSSAVLVRSAWRALFRGFRRG